MRLVHTRNLTLHDFPSNAIPVYAILSHTWSHDEITLQEFSDPDAQTKSGFRKILKFCEHAAAAGFDFGWIDTCCIDKSSSAELSEAINSMFKWYQQASVCFAYLSDVSIISARAHSSRSFRSSRWFTRGWTLQELIAPKDITFYSTEWKIIGTRHELSVEINLATGIDKEVLQGQRPLKTVSIATKFSWAAERKVTRDPEDLAYSLLGICDVAMPLLYGEGEKAFRRLQEEIMKISTDSSLFAWVHDADDPDRTSLLAPHVKNFKESGKFEDKSEIPGLGGPPHQSTSQGITAEVFLRPLGSRPGVAHLGVANLWKVVLKCAEGNDPARFASIEVESLDDQSEYLRVKKYALEVSRLVGQRQTIVVRHYTPAKTQLLWQRFMAIDVRCNVDLAHVVAYSPFKNLSSEQSVVTDSQNTRWNSLRSSPRSSDGTPTAEIIVPSNPLKSKYAIPLMPGSRALMLELQAKPTDKFLLIGIGLDSAGEIGISAEISDRRGDFGVFEERQHHRFSLKVAGTTSIESRLNQPFGKMVKVSGNRDMVFLASPSMLSLGESEQCVVNLAVLLNVGPRPEEYVSVRESMYSLPDAPAFFRVL